MAGPSSTVDRGGVRHVADPVSCPLLVSIRRPLAEPPGTAGSSFGGCAVADLAAGSIAAAVLGPASVGRALDDRGSPPQDASSAATPRSRRGPRPRAGVPPPPPAGGAPTTGRWPPAGAAGTAQAGSASTPLWAGQPGGPPSRRGRSSPTASGS